MKYTRRNVWHYLLYMTKILHEQRIKKHSILEITSTNAYLLTPEIGKKTHSKFSKIYSTQMLIKLSTAFRPSHLYASVLNC